MKYSMEAAVEADRLEEQVFQKNYSIREELGHFQFRPNERILDAGCGTGVLSRYLIENFGVKQIDAIDLSDLRLKQAEKLTHGKSKSAIRFTRQDLSHLDEEFHGQFDTVISRFVVEHCAEPLQVLAELTKAVKPGGRLIIIELDGVFVNLYTQNAQFNAYLEEVKRAFKFDVYIGRKIPNYLNQVGLTKIQWDAELICCKDDRLHEEYVNTEKRFSALTTFLTEALGSRERCEEFKQLYLDEMRKPENTLVFMKYLCCGTKPT